MRKDWKYYLGIVLVCYSVLPYLVLAVLPFMGLTLAQSGTFAVVFLASAEAAFLGAAALLGKEFLHAAKARVLSWFKRAHEPKPVSRRRHRLGVGLFIASFLPYYIVLADLVFFAPKDKDIDFLCWTMIAGELLFMSSMVLLGGQFWDRLKHLFDWPGEPSSGGA